MSRFMRLACLIAVGALAQAACGPSTWQFASDLQMAAAQGHVNATAGSTNNTRPVLKLLHLAPPQKGLHAFELLITAEASPTTDKLAYDSALTGA